MRIVNCQHGSRVQSQYSGLPQFLHNDVLQAHRIFGRKPGYSGQCCCRYHPSASAYVSLHRSAKHAHWQFRRPVRHWDAAMLRYILVCRKCSRGFHQQPGRREPEPGLGPSPRRWYILRKASKRNSMHRHHHPCLLRVRSRWPC
ncbi:hypothetical protein BGW80DRAFT_1559394 [Lactifluus volemus]|nr:hypothetical protein BGW80DRAFT_1559394 [Lactifluus volemus]